MDRAVALIVKVFAVDSGDITVRRWCPMCGEQTASRGYCSRLCAQDHERYRWQLERD